MIKLSGSTKEDVDQNKDGQDVPKLESVEVVLVHCNLVNITIINKHRKYYLRLYQISNLDS